MATFSLTDSAVVDLVPEVRRRSGAGVEWLSDLRINRLLCFHDFDVPATLEAVQKHLAFKVRFGRKVASDAVEGVLLSERFRYLGVNRNGCPIIAINWMWGKFVDVPGGIDVLVEAYVIFQHRTVAKARLELGFPQAEPQLVTVSMGGPFSGPFVNKWLDLGLAHYPESISSTTMYPMDAVTAKVMCRSRRAKVVLASLRPKTSGKNRSSFSSLGLVNMAGNVAELASCINVGQEFLPNDVLQMAPSPTDQTQTVSDVWAELSSEPPQNVLPRVGMALLSDLRSLEASLKHVPSTGSPVATSLIENMKHMAFVQPAFELPMNHAVDSWEAFLQSDGVPVPPRLPGCGFQGARPCAALSAKHCARACAAKSVQFQSQLPAAAQAQMEATVETHGTWKQNGYSLPQPTVENFQSLHFQPGRFRREPVPENVSENGGRKGMEEWSGASESTRDSLVWLSEDTAESSDGVSEDLSGKEMKSRGPRHEVVCRYHF